jgi:hypothetical protein
MDDKSSSIVHRPLSFVHHQHPYRVSHAIAFFYRSTSMAGILDSLNSMLIPEAIGRIGNALGVDATRVNQGMGAAAPTVLANLADRRSLWQWVNQGGNRPTEQGCATQGSHDCRNPQWIGAGQPEKPG